MILNPPYELKWWIITGCMRPVTRFRPNESTGNLSRWPMSNNTRDHCHAKLASGFYSPITCFATSGCYIDFFITAVSNDQTFPPTLQTFPSENGLFPTFIFPFTLFSRGNVFGRYFRWWICRFRLRKHRWGIL